MYFKRQCGKGIQLILYPFSINSSINVYSFNNMVIDDRFIHNGQDMTLVGCEDITQPGSASRNFNKSIDLH